MINLNNLHWIYSWSCSNSVGESFSHLSVMLTVVVPIGGDDDGEESVLMEI